MSQTHQETAVTGTKIRIILQTAGVRVVEYVLPPGDMHAWHHHSEVTDHFYCLEGEITIDVRDPRQTERLHMGQTLSIAPGVMHRAGNPAECVSRYLLVQGVGRYDYVKTA